jgi:hypothetical protein
MDDTGHAATLQPSNLVKTTRQEVKRSPKGTPAPKLSVLAGRLIAHGFGGVQTDKRNTVCLRQVIRSSADRVNTAASKEVLT